MRSGRETHSSVGSRSRRRNTTARLPESPLDVDATAFEVITRCGHVRPEPPDLPNLDPFDVRGPRAMRDGARASLGHARSQIDGETCRRALIGRSSIFASTTRSRSGAARRRTSSRSC